MTDQKPPADFDALCRELADLLDKRVPEGMTYALVLINHDTDDSFVAGEGYMQDALERALAEVENWPAGTVEEEAPHGPN
jgi:hypothetical protein